jgi:signal transduction histidine kinase
MAQPVRFVWQTDEEGRFTLASEEFIRLVGGPTAVLLGRPWAEIADALQLDPDGQIAQAMATQDTWSALTVSWPMETDRQTDGQTDEPTDNHSLAVELSGLPVFDRERNFRGYRGFGICRNAPALSTTMLRAESDTASNRLKIEAMAAVHGASPKVVRFPTSSEAESFAPSLSAAEQEAFQEISRKIGQRLSRRGNDAARNFSAPAGEERGAAGDEDSPGEGAREPTRADADIRAILDRIPAGILIYRLNALLYANASFLSWSGHETLDRLIEAGGLDALFIEPLAASENASAQAMRVTLQGGDNIPLQCELVHIVWDGEPAHGLLALSTPAGVAADVEQLVKARQQAEAASSAKSEFLSKVSHELRTPLNSIIGFAELMLAERFGALGHVRYREYLKDIRDSGAHLLSLVNDLIDLSKIEAGKIELHFSPIDLNEIVGQCVGIMQPQAQRARVIMRSSPGPGPLRILADARSVRQMIFNLLSNSLKFTPAGGQVIVSTSLNDKGETVLRVRDTGTGMTAKEMQTALEGGGQKSSLPERHEGAGLHGAGLHGAGLGLPLTKALAEANRARFCLTSTAGSGTLAQIAFPRAAIPG